MCMRNLDVGVLALFLAVQLPSGICQSAEYALIVGGGYSPTRNPVSIERQVLQGIDVLEKQKFARIDILFADGENPEPDVAEEVKQDEEAAPAQELLGVKYTRRIYAAVFGEDETGLNLRNHRVPNVVGAATKANLQDWIAVQGSRLQPGDTLLLYFATHGTMAPEANSEPSPKHCELLLWDGGRLKESELSSLLRQLPQGVEVRVLITACYSGGFAELGWPSDSAKKETKPNASQLPITGFFATSFDRPAAGCTAAAESLDVHDYATCFWSALGGKWPDGKRVEDDVDLNRDGDISLSEAHAVALVNDNTLDVPLKTSDFALRQISRFGRAEVAHSLTDDPYYDEVLAAAQPAELKLLDQLSARMSLTGQRRLSRARAELRRLNFDLTALAEERLGLSKKEMEMRTKMVASFKETYPELSPKVNDAELSPRKSQQFSLREEQKFLKWLNAVESEPNLVKAIEYQERLAAIDAERLQLEVRWAGYQRFIQTAESVILAHNLPLVVEDKAVLERYESLKRAENSPLAGAR
jgi:hypothetical protein